MDPLDLNNLSENEGEDDDSDKDEEDFIKKRIEAKRNTP